MSDVSGKSDEAGGSDGGLPRAPSRQGGGAQRGGGGGAKLSKCA